MTGLALAFAAGLLSILSPCVLPLVPIVLGAAVTAHPVRPPVVGGTPVTRLPAGFVTLLVTRSATRFATSAGICCRSAASAPRG